MQNWDFKLENFEINYMSLSDFYIKNRPVILSFLGFYLIGLIPLIYFGNYEFSISFNSIHHPFADFFFKNITYIGDGITAFIIVLVVFLIKKREGLMVLVSLLLTTAVAQFLKRYVFSDLFRPTSVFKDLVDNGSWYLVEGVNLHEKYSFPSGHTATVFSVLILIALLINNKKISFFLVFISFVVGLSRIYLSQHFLIDVLAGSLLGTFFSVLTYYFFSTYLNKKKQNTLNNDG